MWCEKQAGEIYVTHEKITEKYNTTIMITRRLFHHLIFLAKHSKHRGNREWFFQTSRGNTCLTSSIGRVSRFPVFGRTPPPLPYCGGIRVLTSICTTISAGRPPTAIMPEVGFLEKVANFIVNAGGYLVLCISSAPGTGDITSTCGKKGRKAACEKISCRSAPVDRCRGPRCPRYG